MAQGILTMSLILMTLVLWGSWMGYHRLVDTRARVQQIVTQGLASGLITPVSQGGGYESEPFGGTGVPQMNLAGVIQQAARVAQANVPGSTAAITATGFQWVLPPMDQRRWDVQGPITVQGVQWTTQAPYAVDATVTAALHVRLFGVASLTVPLRLPLSIPVVGQQAPAQFQSY